jgi:hypothetical protein
MASFVEAAGTVGVLDVNHEPIGERKVCSFQWQVISKGWAVVFTEPVNLDIAGLPDAYYIALYGANDEMLFTLPMVGRPKNGVTLTLGL